MKISFVAIIFAVMFALSSAAEVSEQEAKTACKDIADEVEKTLCELLVVETKDVTIVDVIEQNGGGRRRKVLRN